MTLEEAQILAGGYRLSVAVGAPGEDAAFPPNTVVRQEPAVGTVLLSGDVITVSLNVPAQPTPAPPPVVAPAPPAAEAQPPNDGNESQGRDKNKGKDKGKDKDD
jgi:hypothetical protein